METGDAFLFLFLATTFQYHKAISKHIRHEKPDILAKKKSLTIIKKGTSPRRIKMTGTQNLK